MLVTRGVLSDGGMLLGWNDADGDMLVTGSVGDWGILMMMKVCW